MPADAYAEADADPGGIRVLGRVDDVMNGSGTARSPSTPSARSCPHTSAKIGDHRTRKIMMPPIAVGRATAADD
ncbi:hypothetical protein H0H10_07440 [Streptomyces sp. TRM S81-3]|uniref:Uncharacterized protein n=1 Tax=Streptomyces griseicoloratus TaxID=2752516 RepID=A0A926L0A4_9ACTN|nr:hypothetical protein [Streptomyces griseicoloratus]MBD0419009.1 hypothetical protein [Streptomyces griseicoloratus]